MAKCSGYHNRCIPAIIMIHHWFQQHHLSWQPCWGATVCKVECWVTVGWSICSSWLSWIQFSFCLPNCSEHPKCSVWSTTLHYLVRLFKFATTFVKNALPSVTTFEWLWYASSSAWDRLAMDGWRRRPNLCNLELAQSCILFMDQPLNGHDVLWYIPDFCQREWSCISITRTLCLGKTLGLSGWSITLEPC